jgi:putative membrane protein
MAGLLYLPRLFVYHAGVKKDSEAYAIFKTMESNLLKIIMLPALIATLISGTLLICIIGLESKRLYIKLSLVLVLIGVHHLMAKYAKDFANNNNVKSAKYFRVFNEVPTILMILIVGLAVIKFS